jgi:hypothetical protein
MRQAQTVEDRVADAVKEKELRQAAEDQIASQKSAQIATRRPKELLGRARTMFIQSGTSFFEPILLQNALRKRQEFESWEMAIIDGWDKRNVADVIVEVDRPLFTFTFTYKVTDRSTGMLLATGKLTAFDSNEAAPQLAARLIEEIKKARAESRKN